MIVSFIPGRIRVRITELKGRDLPELPRPQLPGLKSLTLNPLTGGALIEYDPQTLSTETIAGFLEPFDPEGAETLRHPEKLKPQPGPWLKILLGAKGGGDQRSRATQDVVNLGGAFAACLVSGFLGAKKLHLQSAGLLTALLIQHVLRFRKRLKPWSELTLKELLGLDGLFPAPPAEFLEDSEELAPEGSETFLEAEESQGPTPPATDADGEAKPAQARPPAKP
jgi:hypothetical protein